MACEAEKAGYDAAVAEWEAKRLGRIEAENQWLSNQTPNNWTHFQIAMQHELAALAAMIAAHNVWQACLQMGSGGAGQ